MAKANNVEIEVLGLDAISEIIEAAELKKEVCLLGTKMRFDLSEGLKGYFAPELYERKYGLEKGSLLSDLLEAYHQLRLKDEYNN